MADDKIGTLNQCLGLTDALGLQPLVKRAQPRRPWRWLPAAAWPLPLLAQQPGADRLAPPWPDLLIAAGRSAVAPAAAIRRRAAGRTLVVAIQNPRLDPRRFDLVVVPQHDRLTGPNILVTDGALNRITPAKLATAADRFAAAAEHLPPRRLAVLIGGGNRHYRLDAGVGADLGRKLAALADRGFGLMITASRRTDPRIAAELRRRLDRPAVWFWDGTGDNPYLGFLALAEQVLVTSDSASMLSEVATAGKPLQIIPLPGRGGKFDRLQARLVEAGAARRFAGEIGAPWSYPAWREADRVARHLRLLMETR